MIKKILVPIDYSDVSLNALKYALEFNKIHNAKIFLLHVFDMPALVNGSDDPEIEEYDAHKAQHKEKLQHIVTSVSSKYPYEYEVCTTAGGHAIEIQDFTIRNTIDMVIIGNTGMGGIKRWLYGTVAIHLLTQSYIPVLAVPSGALYEPVKKMLLIIDYNDFLTDVNLDFLSKFCAQLEIELELALISNEEVDERYKKSFLRWVEIEFKKQPHFINMKTDEDIIEAVDKLTAELNIDVITGVPHAHNWMEILFLGKCINKVPVICKKPLMTLPLTRDSFI